MANKKVFTAEYRRKSEGRTDYRKRLILLKSKLPRLVVRKSNKHMLAQIIEYNADGDKVLFTATTKELSKLGWDFSCKSIPAAYLVGLLVGVKSKGQKAIFDMGMQSPIKGSRIYAALKGAADGRLDIPYSEEIFPSEDRITGKHIASYAKESGKKGDNLTEVFQKVKKAILSGKE
jgi:large subunit ribosomal protein L18